MELACLPNDPAALQQMLLAERAMRVQRDADLVQRDAVIVRRDQRIAALEQRTQELELARRQLELDKLLLAHQLELYKKRYYGPRADTLEASQLLLEFARELEARPAAAVIPAEQAIEAAASAEPQPHPRRVRRGRRNLALFNALPAVQKIHDLSDAQKRQLLADGGELVEIAPEITWQVEYQPGHFYRIEHLQKKYVVKPAQSQQEVPAPVVLADKPQEGLSKCMAGPGLLAYVVTSKYADYLPLYRLQGIFERNGLELDRSTQCLWCADVAELVAPLWRVMKERVLAGHVVATDDTVMPLLAPEKTRPARMWIYRGDDANPYNVFDFTVSRGRDGPDQFLGDYQGVLLGDGYGIYDGICTDKPIAKAACWAHARRKFTDCQDLAPDLCAVALGLIGTLFAVEREAKEKALSPGDRLALRQEKSLPVMQTLRQKLEAWKLRMLPKHPFTQAVGYVLNQWEALNVFLADGAVALDNNLAEQEMKRIALLRKNALFVGTEQGGETAARLSSITSTCRRLGVNVQVYLTQLLVNLPGTPLSQVAHWLPDAWQKRQTAPTPPAQPAHT